MIAYRAATPDTPRRDNKVQGSDPGPGAPDPTDARPSYPDHMTAFGGIFRSPGIDGVEESEDSGQRARLVGLDLDSGVVRVRAARPEPTLDEPPDPPAEDSASSRG